MPSEETRKISQSSSVSGSESASRRSSGLGSHKSQRRISPSSPQRRVSQQSSQRRVSQQSSQRRISSQSNSSRISVARDPLSRRDLSKLSTSSRASVARGRLPSIFIGPDAELRHFKGRPPVVYRIVRFVYSEAVEKALKRNGLSMRGFSTGSSYMGNTTTEEIELSKFANIYADAMETNVRLERRRPALRKERSSTFLTESRLEKRRRKGTVLPPIISQVAPPASQPQTGRRDTVTSQGEILPFKLELSPGREEDCRNH